MSEVDKGWSPAFGILFFWYSHRYSMWSLTSVPVKDDTSSDHWANAEVYLSSNEDWSKVWCPWNSEGESNIEIQLGSTYYVNRLHHYHDLAVGWQRWYKENIGDLRYAAPETPAQEQYMSGHNFAWLTSYMSRNASCMACSVTLVYWIDVI